MNKNIILAKKNPLYVLLWILVSIYFCFDTLAVQIIDIDNFLFPATQQKGVRLVSFDTENQKYKQIDYFIQPTPTTASFDLLDISFDSECNINISSDFPFEEYTIITKGRIKIDDDDVEEVAINDSFASDSDRWIFNRIDDFNDKGAKVDRLILSYKKIEIKYGLFVMRELNNWSGKSKDKKDFEATFHSTEGPEKKTFKNLCSDQENNRKERGVLGELATKLTMISFGYDKYYSKYGTDNGFDGVFKDSSEKPELFISESKCQERQDGAKTILGKNLSEEKIVSKVNRIFKHNHPTLSIEAKDCLIETGKFIGEYMAQLPNDIFKFAHRIKPDGTCECLVEKFDVAKYRANLLYTISPQSPTKDKLSALNIVATQISSSKEEKILLLLESISPKSKEEKLKLIFTALGITNPVQNQIFDIIPNQIFDIILKPKAQKKLLFSLNDEENEGKEKDTGSDAETETEKSDDKS